MTTQTPIAHRRHALLVAALHAACASTAQADCIDDAATRHHVSAAVLRAIGWQESRLRPEALGRNADGSIDIGAFQINSVHLPELHGYGIDPAALADGCISAEVAAWHYRRQIDRFGNDWKAVGAWHSTTPARTAWYANRIAAILMQWRLLPNGTLPFPAAATLAPGGPPPALRPPRAGASAAAAGPQAPPAGTQATDYREVAYAPSTR